MVAAAATCPTRIAAGLTLAQTTRVPVVFNKHPVEVAVKALGLSAGVAASGAVGVVCLDVLCVTSSLADTELLLLLPSLGLLLPDAAAFFFFLSFRLIDGAAMFCFWLLSSCCTGAPRHVSIQALIDSCTNNVGGLAHNGENDGAAMLKTVLVENLSGLIGQLMR